MPAEYKKRQLHGLLVLNKPKGPTSTGCLEMIKRKLGQKKIGHAGTLDPMAQGVLLVLLGGFTKIAPYLTEGTKVYSGRIRLGLTTDTYDMEGEVVGESDVSQVSTDSIEKEVAAWEELTSQTVPPYSAAKHKGKPLYKLSRDGKTPPVKTKNISIHKAEVLHIDLPFVEFRVECSSGTYIRSLAHSLGIRLACGAALEQLTREESRPFGLDQAHDLDHVLSEPERFPERVLSMREALPHWPAVTVDAETARRIGHGMRPEFEPNPAAGENFVAFSPGNRALFLSPEGTPLALMETAVKDGKPVWDILRGLAQA